MRTKNKTSRRSFLKLAAAGAGAATTAPWIWIPKKAFAAATPGFGSAKHVLVLYAGGGLRSAPLFHANVPMQFNPFGKAASVAPGTNWGVGSVLGTQAIPLNSFPDPTTVLPPVPDIANDIAILAGVDHSPGSSMSPTDHGTGDLGVTTGDPMGNSDRGLLSIVHRDLPGYVSGSIALPPFDIGLSNFGMGRGDFSGFKPIAVGSAADFTGKSANSEQEAKGVWARTTVRALRDQRMMAARAPHVRPYLGAAKDAKINSRYYAEALHSPALDLMGAPEADHGGVSNQQMLEVLGSSPFGGSTTNWGLEVAFALRLMQLGVPAVSVLRYLYDDHSDEKTQLPIDAGDLGRQIAGLHFLLHRMMDDTGTPLWNSTVVFVMSEFSRDDTDPSTGFNSAMGSDHQGSPAQRNQIWPVFGGPIAAKGRQIGTLDPATMQTVGGPAMSIRSVHATVLDVLGIDSSNHYSDAPISALFT